MAVLDPFLFFGFLRCTRFVRGRLGRLRRSRGDSGRRVPAVLFIVLIALFVRIRAIRADATLVQAETSEAGQLVAEHWPFSLEAPPRRRPLWGYILSAAGFGLWMIGVLGGGLVANGVLWPILLLAGLEIDGAGRPPPVAVMGFALLAIGIGVPLHVFGLTAGPRLRDRGRRFCAHDARSLIQQKGEQPVLLLRSFEDEDLQDPRPLSILQRRYEQIVPCASPTGAGDHSGQTGRQSRLRGGISLLCV